MSNASVLHSPCSEQEQSRGLVHAQSMRDTVKNTVKRYALRTLAAHFPVEILRRQEHELPKVPLHVLQADHEIELAHDWRVAKVGALSDGVRRHQDLIVLVRDKSLAQGQLAQTLRLVADDHLQGVAHRTRVAKPLAVGACVDRRICVSTSACSVSCMHFRRVGI